MRTDGVHCRESAGIGSVVLKVVSVTVLPSNHHEPVDVHLSFSPPTYNNIVSVLFLLFFLVSLHGD